MDLKIGKTITATELQECEHIAQFGVYEIYLLNEDISFLFAIDNTNLICSCFEFFNGGDSKQLRQMNTHEDLKKRGIGKKILELAVERLEEFELPSIDTSQMYYFNEEGLDWIRRRFDDCTLKQPPFIRP